jgi:hypothetical protein
MMPGGCPLGEMVWISRRGRCNSGGSGCRGVFAEE